MADTTEKPRNELIAVPPKAGGAIKPFVPGTVEELKYIAGLIIKGGMAPDSYNNDPQKIALGIIKGMEVGLPPLTALGSIAIINGKPSIWGDGAVALVQSRSLITRHEEKYEGNIDANGDLADNFTAIYRIWRKGQEEAYEGRFSVADAKRARLWGNPKRQPWMLYPKRMLLNRARAFALRDGFADCLSGLSIREEMEDTATVPKQPDASFLEDEPMKDITPEERAEETPAQEAPDFLKDAAPGSLADNEDEPELGEILRGG